MTLVLIDTLASEDLLSCKKTAEKPEADSGSAG